MTRQSSTRPSTPSTTPSTTPSIKHRDRRRMASSSSIFSISLFLFILSTSISILLPSTVNSTSQDESSISTPPSTISPRSPPITKRGYSHLESASLSKIPLLSDPSLILNQHSPTSFLSSILIPRPPETSNNLKVQSLIIDQFKSTSSNWKIEQPKFKAITPEGEKQMSNLIFTLNERDSHSKLTLAAHHDSKWFKKGSGMEGFVGATDSASPCAMLVDLVVSLDKPLKRRRRRAEWELKRWQREELELDLQLERELEDHEEILRKRNLGDDEEIVRKELKELKRRKEEDWKQEHEDWLERNEKRLKREKTTLQILFFDGEEAYHTWTHTDSIYGSKSLASNWTSTYHSLPPLSPRRYLSTTTSTSLMNSIEHLVLLDLLGARDPTIPSYYDSTNWLHDELIDIEKRLKDANLLYPKDLSEKEKINKKSFFKKNQNWHGGIEDDHLPFIAEGVPVLHVIPTPFPNVWHRLSDDASALDYPTTYAWAMILRTLVVEYLGLDLNDLQLRDDENVEDQDEDELLYDEEKAKKNPQSRTTQIDREGSSFKNLTTQDSRFVEEKNENFNGSTVDGSKLSWIPARRSGYWKPKTTIERAELKEEEIWEREWLEQRKRDLLEWNEKKRKRKEVNQ